MSERLVVDDTSVYMIDEECMQKKERQKQKDMENSFRNRIRNQKEKGPARH